MKNFGRAVKQALRFWPSLLLATLCSCGVASLWGANIGALFPIIQVTLEGRSLQQWIAGEIAKSEQTIAQLDQQEAQLRASLETAADAERLSLQQQLESLNSRRAVEQASLASSRRMQPLIDRFLPTSPFRTVVVIVGLLMVSTGIKHLFLLGNTMLVGRAALHISRDIHRQIFDKALTMDRAGFGCYGSSGFLANITHTSQMLTSGIQSLLGGAIREPLKILSCLIGAALISWRLLLASLLLAPLVLLLLTWVSRQIKAVCRRSMEKALGFHHVMLEAFNNMQTVQAYGMEEAERKRFASSTLDMLRLGLRIIFFNSLTRPITELLGVGMVSTAVVVGAYLVLNHETHILGIQMTDRPPSVATLLVFFGLLIGASDPVRKMATVFSGINTGMIAADMLFPLLDRQSTIAEPARPRAVPRPHSKLQFCNVQFGYDPNHPVLRDVNFEIAYGETVAIVGPNGAGKSTLVNLICRFYDPQQGCVMLDGVDLREMSLKDLRSRVGLVLQQSQLFNESVGYNIRYGSPDSTEAEMVQAAKRAHADQFITTALPQQYETPVGQDGCNLSGGQRQRVALARAILRDPEILILDEATSQVDRDSERLIHDAILEFGRQRTVIFITHRPSSIELADSVIEVGDGRAVKRQLRQQAA